MKNRNFLLHLISFTIFFISNVHASDLSPCVEDKINAYRAEMGADAAIRMDIIGEWEDECSGGSYTSDENLNDSSHTKNFSTQSQSPDFRVSIQPKWSDLFSFQMETIEFQATEDNVIIKSIDINRGNCKVNEERLPITLGFGQVRWLVISCPVESVLEVVVQSSRGRWTFEIDN